MTIAVAATARSAQFVDTLLFLIVAVEADGGTGTASAVLLAHQFAVVGGTLAGGALVDRIGARVVVIAGLAVSASALAVLSQAGAPGALIAAATLYGLGAAVWRLHAQRR